MVERRLCTFCGNDIEPGTGKMYVKKDGTIYYFCKNKCSKNMVDLGRNPRRVTWTKHYAQEKQATLAATGKKVDGKKKKKAPARPKKESEPEPDTKGKKAASKKPKKEAKAKKEAAPKEAKPKKKAPREPETGGAKDVPAPKKKKPASGKKE